jgi:hypothetical protein
MAIKKTADKSDANPAPDCVRMVRAQGHEAGYPADCLVHPDEVAHMLRHDWIIDPNADRSTKE